MMHEIDGAKQPTSQTSYWSRYFMARRHGTFARGLHTGGKGIGMDPSFVTEGSEVSAANGKCNGTFGRIRSETPGGATSASISTSSIGMWQDS